MLTPPVVGDIARGDADPAAWTAADVQSLIRHDLAYPATVAIAGRRADDPVLAPLRHAATAKQFRSVSVAATATLVAQVLADAGVRSLSYKGPALAAQSTGTWLGRGSTDVDVLVDPADCARADDALRAAGARSRAGYAAAPTRWERYHRQERAYVGLPVTVDLHWRIDSGPGYFTTAFGALWQRREAIDLDGLAVSTLDRVDALLVTAVHGAKERWSRWSWALDAVRQAGGLAPDLWPLAVERARLSGSRAALDLCLGVVEACGADVPAGLVPDARLAREARAWVAAATAGQVEWSLPASLARRRARWVAADTPVVAADGFARAVARLLNDRRAPGSPQSRGGQGPGDG